ncbi:DEAD/DEAH box helicase [Pontibacter roseus]|uniref:DEAD/DEAH box helicase n=1 Tax=Pontibacter roseus TaxID=336989 RepID=UPI0003706748|nr:DEAD/DEAH box helicase [Pontibacter roseus]
MTNLIEVNYDTNGNSIRPNNSGMREMQARAFSAREAQYLLLKAPPASGKSRALMFIALDKLANQGIKKVIVAVPERSIASSFCSTDLKSGGFHSDWNPNPRYDLCAPGGEPRKVNTFKEFIDSEDNILICTHATLRFAFNELDVNKFNQCLIAIDEFHHVSADYESKLGELIRALMNSSNAHIIAMTGSYFRGDSVPVLMPEDEAKFFKITYNYYEQLNGYKYLKSLGIGYHFYQGRYTNANAIGKVLDTDKKTILHIPNVNSGEALRDKYREVDAIIDIVGTYVNTDPNTKIISVERSDGKIIKVANLVEDDPTHREKTITYLRNISSADDVDLIIALGMAKEGFDWPYCEHALTVGYRGSLTEIVQIIGRCTRDSINKTHAQFTNLIAEPDAENEEVIQCVNNMLKAITASLLMEQVLAPTFKFKSKKSSDDPLDKNEVVIKGLRESDSARVKHILESDLTDLKASILQDSDIVKAMPGNVDPEVINKVMIPKVVKLRYPHLNDEEIEEVSQHVVADSVIKHAKIKQEGNRRFIQLANDFINIEDINIDLINQVNPFQNAFEVLSKALTPRVLKAVQQCIAAFKIRMTDDEAIQLWHKINNFVRATGRKPSLDALDPTERRMAEAIIYLQNARRQQSKDDHE